MYASGVGESLKGEIRAMKIIEAMKQKEDLLKKAADLRSKIGKHCAYLSYETPTYGSQGQQTEQVRQWVQAHSDILREVIRLRLAIQRTNVTTEVPIELGGKIVTKTIAEWVIRRGSPNGIQGLADLEKQGWDALGDRGLKEGQIKTSEGEVRDVKICRCYDPLTRDIQVENLRSEPARIDAALEIANATIDLVLI